MEMSPEQQKALEQQKANCIFCQIISGNIPSKNVFEDDKIIGILDINPASKGHTLLMPKEHYPIMPLIPTETFKQLFAKAKGVDNAIKEALLCNETTIFIANGSAAGQQSNHFMLHIIPREKGDGLPFETSGKEAKPGDITDLKSKAGEFLNAMLSRNLTSLGFTKAEKMPQRLNKQQVIQIINSNPSLKQIVIEKPEQFKQIVPTHPQLSQILTGFDLDEIISLVGNQDTSTGPKKLTFGEGKK